MISNNKDDKTMVRGVSQILGFTPYLSVLKEDPCDHEDDGYVYGENTKRYTFHCHKCGEFYEEDK